ncbi:MAG: hypothetical protein J0I42_17020 [Bosea sp.]|uniref:hypothetical protein n=1 Tax=Bosea sp. (in: a-proteobacteria) TaxID=1871050 RepID=UPI001AD3F88A|nr:hypothetical protein [Bosea sp. (in: a-proteobacteria)]MBN9453647.1 hypothetical protein [Bosea sp. (in: a-proteobacteria)]
MSDSPFLIAESFVTMRAEATRHVLQTEMVKQQADAEKGLVEMLERSIEEQKAALPLGQGQHLDVTV